MRRANCPLCTSLRDRRPTPRSALPRHLVDERLGGGRGADRLDPQPHLPVRVQIPEAVDERLHERWVEVVVHDTDRRGRCRWRVPRHGHVVALRRMDGQISLHRCLHSRRTRSTGRDRPAPNRVAPVGTCLIPRVQRGSGPGRRTTRWRLLVVVAAWVSVIASRPRAVSLMPDQKDSLLQSGLGEPRRAMHAQRIGLCQRKILGPLAWSAR